jgi:hypothetical protein
VTSTRRLRQVSFIRYSMPAMFRGETPRDLTWWVISSRPGPGKITVFKHDQVSPGAWYWIKSCGAWRTRGSRKWRPYEPERCQMGVMLPAIWLMATSTWLVDMLFTVVQRKYTLHYQHLPKLVFQQGRASATS